MCTEGLQKNSILLRTLYISDWQTINYSLGASNTIKYSSGVSSTINYSLGASKTNLTLISAPKESLLLEKTFKNFDTIHEGYSKVAKKMLRLFLLRDFVSGWI